MTEEGISAQLAVTAAADATALTGVEPMAPDADSAQFAVALNAAGAAYLAATAEHFGQRASVAGGQGLAAGTYDATEVLRAANLA
ncbi:PE family protein [Mycobacterium sp.]|uniref:PE family protein n=1 Tax=Mycobacterium sp. TaxID=1785 RepID=UPI0031D5B205